MARFWEETLLKWRTNLPDCTTLRGTGAADTFAGPCGSAMSTFAAPEGQALQMTGRQKGRTLVLATCSIASKKPQVIDAFFRVAGDSPWMVRSPLVFLTHTASSNEVDTGERGPFPGPRVSNQNVQGTLARLLVYPVHALYTAEYTLIVLAPAICWATRFSALPVLRLSEFGS